MTLQQQLLLDLQLDQPPTLDNFVIGANAELIARLRSLTDRHRFDSVYVWGPAGCGKSHLLAATASAASVTRPVIHLPFETVLSGGGEFKHRPLNGSEVTVTGGSLLVIDEVQALDEEGQRALFRLFNTARFLGLALLLSGTAPPMHLALREDLRTRIGQMLIYEIHPLSDEEKAAALAHHAKLRGMVMDPGVVQYLLRHNRRDLPSLMRMLESLDRISLEQHRPLTVPLVREMMQMTLDTMGTHFP